MAVQLSIAVRNARLDAIEVTTGATAVLRIRTGAQPATCATADSGTVLAEMTLPANWMADAAAGAKALSGTWEDLAGNAAGTAGHWRIYESTGTTCHLQGSCSLPLADPIGDMVLTNTNIAVGQAVTVTAFTLTDGNA